MRAEPGSAQHLPPAAGPTPAQRRALWAMLMALCVGFTLSQAFRTVAAMMAKPLQAEFGLGPAELGLFAATFHFTFGAMQLFMGIGIDLHGVRRTVLLASPLAVAGALLSALAPSFPLVVLGQALIGVGCAPAFLACTVFIARRFPGAEFAAVSGLVMGLGGIGLLITGTPLAWVAEHYSWRTGFALLGAGAALGWGVIFLTVREVPPSAAAGGDDGSGAPRESALQALRGFGALFTLPHTWGIVLLASVTYASFLTLRGLWLGPMLIEQHGFSLVQSGNVALAVSVVGLFGPPAFGRMRTEGRARRRWIVGLTLGMAALFGVLAWAPGGAAPSVAVAVLLGLVSGYIVLQYADVRASYPEALTGRALAVFTMAMFLGIALMQWITGAAAAFASAHGLPPFAAVNGTVALLLVLGATAFATLPSAVK